MEYKEKELLSRRERMVSYLCTALAVSLNPFPLTQYTNFTHGLPFQSSSSANTAAWKLQGAVEQGLWLLWSGTGPVNQGTVLCLWSRYNLLGMAGFFSFQSEGISVSLDNESKQPSKPVSELSRI